MDLFIMRYVEGNPVRAWLVSSAKEWEWSSHGERIGKVVAERKQAIARWGYYLAAKGSLSPFVLLLSLLNNRKIAICTTW